MKEPPNVFNYIPFFFSFWNVIINACLRHHPKSRAALYIVTTLENFDLKAITVLIRKKIDISTVISFIFLFSFVPIDFTIHHGCMRLMYYFKSECEGFTRVSKHEKTDGSTRPQAECFYCFRVFENPDETRMHNF